jgi:acyl transferase domain-containing protein
LRDALFPRRGGRRKAAKLMARKEISRAAIFVVEYAMARLLMSWGVYPDALIGNGIGQYTAACLSGVIPLNEMPTVLTCHDDPGHMENIPLQQPVIPIVSGISGGWLTPEEAKDTAYWREPLLEKSHFSDGLKALAISANGILLEVGPGSQLGAVAKERHESREAVILSSLPAAGEKSSAREVLLRAIGQMWLCGVPIDWKGFHAHEQRRRIPLPLYPFEKKRYWIPRASAEAPPQTGPILFTD